LEAIEDLPDRGMHIDKGLVLEDARDNVAEGRKYDSREETSFGRDN
jgi:hypothetical protein